MKSVYTTRRSEIFWLPDEVTLFEAEAPAHIAQILSIALETGLRPGDLNRLSLEHVQRTPNGRRLVIWTQKRNRLASIPVTARMSALIDSTPGTSKRLILNKGGEPYQHASYLGDAVSVWRDKLGIRPEIRLCDARGTAATRLLEAGADLKEIATHMGWFLKHVAEVIERYMALSPAMFDSLAAKLQAAKSNT